MALDRARNQGIIILVTICCAVMIYWVVRIMTGDETSRIRRIVYSIVVAVEKSDVSGCASFIAPDYEDRYGNDKKKILEVISNVFEDFRNFQPDIKKLDIEIKGSKARADIGFMVCFKVKDEKQLYYDSGKIAASFKKEDGLWKIVRIEYAGSNELLFINAVA